MFITFEANEGAGKSTQARALAAYLTSIGHEVVLTREPGGSPVAEELRSFVVQGDPDRIDPETELLIFTAARRDHVMRTVKPALAAGKIVICDRYVGSTRALQGAAGRLPMAQIDLLHETFVGLDPDLTILIDIPVEIGLARAGHRIDDQPIKEGRFEAKGEDFHRAVSEGFLAQAREADFWEVIDGEGSVEEVGARIRRLVESRLAARDKAA